MKKEITTTFMYDIINCHKEYIVDRLGQKTDENKKSALEIYSDLKNCLKAQNIKGNADFKKTYVKFFGMGQSRLIPSYYDCYFSLLDENKGKPEVSLPDILRSLRPVSKTSKGRQSLQFSFATKLVHMINDEEPIYDSRIKFFYNITEPPSGIEFAGRIATYLDIQKSITSEYHRIVRDKLMEPSIRYFRRKYLDRGDHSDIKVIDWIIWQFVSLVNGGWIRETGGGNR